MDQKTIWLAAVGKSLGIISDDVFESEQFTQIQRLGVSDNPTVDILNIAMNVILEPPSEESSRSSGDKSSAPLIADVIRDIGEYIINIMAIPFKLNNQFIYPKETSPGGFGYAITRAYSEAVVAVNNFKRGSYCRICNREHHELRHIGIGLSVVIAGLKLPVLTAHFRDKPNIWNIDGALVFEPDWQRPTLMDFFMYVGDKNFRCVRCPRSTDQIASGLNYKTVLYHMTNTKLVNEPSPEINLEDLFFHMFLIHTGDFCYYFLNDVIPVKFTSPFFVKFSDFSDSFHFMNRIRTDNFIIRNRYNPVSEIKPQPEDALVVDSYSSRWIDAAEQLCIEWAQKKGIPLEGYSKTNPALAFVKIRKNWDDTAKVDHISSTWRKRLRDMNVTNLPSKRPSGGAPTQRTAAVTYHRNYAGFGYPGIYSLETLVDFENKNYGDVIGSTGQHDIVYGGSETFTNQSEVNNFLLAQQKRLFLMSGQSIFGECFQIDLFRTMNGMVHSVLFMKRISDLRPAVPDVVAPDHFVKSIRILPQALQALTNTILLINDIGFSPIWKPEDIFIHDDGIIIKLPQDMKLDTIDIENYLAIVNIVLTGTVSRAQYTNQEREMMGSNPGIARGLMMLKQNIKKTSALTQMPGGGPLSDIMVKSMTTVGAIASASILPSNNVTIGMDLRSLGENLIATNTDLIFRELENLL